MSPIKKPAENTSLQIKNNIVDQDQNNNNDRSQEVDLPIPERKNDDITTGNIEKSGKNVEKVGKIKSDETTERTEKNRSFKTGFDVDNKAEKNRSDKRKDENEKLDRDDTTNPKTKDANWQQEKMNEADNQQGSKEDNETEGNLKDTRNDSILERPRTETYESNPGDNAGGELKEENYFHNSEEEKRDKQNRKHSED